MYIIRNIIIHRRTSSISLTRGSFLPYYSFSTSFFSSSTTDTTGLSLDNCCTAPFPANPSNSSFKSMPEEAF